MAKKTIKVSNSSWKGTSKKDKVYIDYADYVKVSTGGGNDSIYNDLGYYATIDAGTGNDTITLYYGKASSVNAGAGNDRVSLYGGSPFSVITVTGGAGNDTVYSSGYKTLHQYASGDGNDVIFNWSESDTLKIAGGKYTKKTSGKDVILTVGSGKITLKGAKGKTLNIDGTLDSGGKGTEGNDKITNTKSYATINALGGNDTVYNNNGDYSSINTGDGNDSIYAYDNDCVTVNAGAGKDTITGSYFWSKIYGGTGNDKISITGSSYSNTVDGGDDSDTITAYGGSISGGAGNDRINITYNGATVKGGTGNDTVSLYSNSYGNLIQYTSGDGNDLIYGVAWTDTISITGGSYTRSTVGSDVVLKVGKGSITLKNAASTTINIKGTLQGGSSTPTVPPDTVPSGDLLEGTNGHDNLQNLSTGVGKVIYAYSGNDTVTNSADNVYISGGSGNDYIKSYSDADNVTVHGDAGADNITVSSNNALIYGDDGNDKIWAYREGNFIYGGSGDDYIYTENNNNGFVSGDAGDDTITAYKGTHLTLSGGAGNDSLWGSSGSDTLIGGSGNDIFVYKPGEGIDHITDFSGGDMLKILKTSGGEGGTFTSATFSGGSLTLEISGGGTVILDNVSTGNKININGTTRTISGSTLK